MDLYFKTRGKGHPIVLIHGGGADLREWRFLEPLLAEHYQVVTADARGVGQSPAPEDSVNYVEDVLLLINELKLEKPTIIGHSLGGQVATEFSLAYPERVSNLVLIAPALTGFQGYTEFEHIMKNVLEAAPDIDKMIELVLHSPLYQVVLHSPQRDLAIHMLRDQFQRMFEAPAIQMIWPDPPAIDRLEELVTKTLFIIGQKDLAENFLAAEHFKKVPNINFVEIPDADHMLTLTHSKELSQEIIDFMKN